MLHHSACTVGSYGSGPLTGGTPQIEVNPLSVTLYLGFPIVSLASGGVVGNRAKVDTKVGGIEHRKEIERERRREGGKARKREGSEEEGR